MSVAIKFESSIKSLMNLSALQVLIDGFESLNLEFKKFTRAIHIHSQSDRVNKSYRTFANASPLQSSAIKRPAAAEHYRYALSVQRTREPILGGRFHASECRVGLRAS
jgi:hypothetical protein